MRRNTQGFRSQTLGAGLYLGDIENRRVYLWSEMIYFSTGKHLHRLLFKEYTLKEKSGVNGDQLADYNKRLNSHIFPS